MVNVITRLRSWFGVVFVVVYTLFCAGPVILAGVLGLNSLASRLMRYWSAGLVGVFGIQIESHGEENLPLAGGGIILFNHQSHFDIPSIILSTYKNIRFGAKIELFRIPIFGPAMRSVGTLPIARDNRSEVLNIYKLAAKRFAQNTIFVLAPEGTRQREAAIGKFKKGPFYFAAGANVPLIPVVIRGAMKVLPKGSLTVNVGRWSRAIEVHILPPVSTEGYDHENMDELVERIRNQMVQVYETGSAHKIKAPSTN